MEVKIILKQEIIELVRLSVAESVIDVGFNFSQINIRTRGLISYKCVCKLTKYVDQLLISIITIIKF